MFRDCVLFGLKSVVFQTCYREILVIYVLLYQKSIVGSFSLQIQSFAQFIPYPIFHLPWLCTFLFFRFYVTSTHNCTYL